MTDSSQSTPVNSVAGALDQTLDHIAAAHGLIDRIRSSATNSGESEQLLKEVDRIWHALEISGVLTTQMVRRLELEAD